MNEIHHKKRFVSRFALTTKRDTGKPAAFPVSRFSHSISVCGQGSAQTDAHAAGHAQQLAVLGHIAGLTGNVCQTVLGHPAVYHGYGHAVALHLYQLCGIAAELGSQHTVVGAGAAAALHMTWDAHAGLHAGLFLHGLCNAVGGGGAKTGLGALGHPVLALHAGFLGVDGTLGHGKDGEVGTLLGAALHGLAYAVDIVGQLRQQDDVGTAGNTGVQGKPAGLVAHDLDAHHAAVAACGGVDAVDNVGGDVHSGMEAEGDVGAVDVVVDGLGQADDVQEKRSPFSLKNNSDKRARLMSVTVNSPDTKGRISSMMRASASVNDRASTK